MKPVTGQIGILPHHPSSGIPHDALSYHPASAHTSPWRSGSSSPEENRLAWATRPAPSPRRSNPCMRIGATLQANGMQEHRMKTETGTASNSVFHQAMIQPVVEPAPVFIRPGWFPIESADGRLLTLLAFVAPQYTYPMGGYICITRWAGQDPQIAFPLADSYTWKRIRPPGRWHSCCRARQIRVCTAPHPCPEEEDAADDQSE